MTRSTRATPAGVSRGASRYTRRERKLLGFGYILTKAERMREIRWYISHRKEIDYNYRKKYKSIRQQAHKHGGTHEQAS
jgi:hypothetical protein